MKFSNILGNPPYQLETEKISETNGQLRSKSIFHLFQQEADKICNGTTCLIYPGGRWIQRSGKGMASFGLNQINDPKLKSIHFYPDSGDIFNGVAIGDGISIVTKCNKKNSNNFEYYYHSGDTTIQKTMFSPGENILPLNPNDYELNEKLVRLMNKYNLPSMHERILPQKLFGIESEFVEKNSNLVRPFTNVFDTEKEVKLFANDKAGKAGRTTWFICDKDLITSGREYINKYKVIVSSANAGGQKRDRQLEIVDNYSVFGRSRVALGAFDSLNEAKNFYKYVNSKIISYAFLQTDEALTTLGYKVPDFVDYLSTDLIDYSSDVDAQLKVLLDLTDDEYCYLCNVVDHIRG